MAYELFTRNTPRIRGVLFDMDGLVLDSEILYSKFWMAACHFYGFPMTREQSLRMRAVNSTIGTGILQELFGPTVDYSTVRNKRIELMDAFIAENGVELKPGVRELLEYLHSHGIRCAITSSSPLARIQQHLAFHGLDKEFDALCSGHEVKTGKPAPDIYLYGAASLGLAPEECLALEDAPAGIESAFRAGCHPILIPDLDTPGEETLSKCFAKADSLLDIIDILEYLQNP